MKAVVFTLGCKVNSYESASLIRGLSEKGYEVSEELSYADLYIINTCAVTSEAEKKSRQAVARVRKFNENAPIIITGCASENNPQSFIGKKGVTLVTGTEYKDKILSMLENTGVEIEKHTLDYKESLIPKTSKTRAYIKIQDGCNNFCSYCIIPYLRGRSRSRSIVSVKREIELLKPLEAVLTAINLTAYNYENQTLTDLIKALSDLDVRIRLGSLEENIITEEFLLALKNLKDFAPHFHLSLQSGSTKTLKAMNRKYTAEDFLNSIYLIRKYFKNAGITTDIIVGFPSETDKDFEDTLEFVKKAMFSDIHCFPYSARQGTKSYKMQDLPSAVKKSRLDKLLELKNQLKQEFILSNIDKELEFITEEFDGTYTLGYTENYIKVYALGQLEGGKYKVKLVKPYKDGAIIELI